ncbi:DUF4097 family beta strand repeat-containing protein [Sphaerisporangium perillae]|uniref:DUF4097 family beta strand repeat-containing protein n=1 Tax=Sphaerisporangium perillae TaxID=2935860 RepID=UPI00200C2528|nr:DUF4097 family beta strand repeat-containing protein [Sphaerisporangium perillae]
MAGPRRAIAAAALLGAGLLLTGCGLTDIAAPTKEEKNVYDVTEKTPVLHVESGSGEILVTESDRTGFHVTETLHWKSDKPVTRHPVEGDTLKLGYDCPNENWTCDVDYAIEVPRGVQVKLKTGSGDITLRALSGRFDADTGSGTIDANGLGGKQAVAKTGSGDVDLRFTAVPDNVDVRTGSGTGVVHVPQGAYDVNLSTGSGEKKIDVTDDDSSSRSIVVKTGSGDAKVLKT